MKSKLLILGCASCISACQHTPPSADVMTFSQMDALQSVLAERAADRMGNSEDFKIIVTQAAYPIGTVMRQSSTIPIDYESCKPAKLPDAFSTPNLFPTTYTITQSLALDFGLDQKAISKLVEFGANIKDSDSVSLSISAPQIQTLSDGSLVELLGEDRCSLALPGSPVWLVRGYIRGKRTFALRSDTNRSMSAKLERVGNFNVDLGSGGASLSISDAADADFLQVVSEVSKPPSRRNEAVIQIPSIAPESGRIYIQKDKLDASGASDQAVVKLQAIGLPVATAIEGIESNKMPRQSQVRYFNESDLQKAEQIIAALKESHPAIELRRIALPAPRGQIEVWLTKPN